MGDLGRACAAEFIGTFALCFVGVGSIVLTAPSGPGAPAAGSLVTVALAFGLVLVVFVTACLHVSGSQFNPAVSVALLCARRQGVTRTGAFVATQCVGAVAAVWALDLILGASESAGAMLGAVRHGATYGRFGGEEPLALATVGLEALMTFSLMLVIMATIVDHRAPRLAGVWVGGTVAANILAFGPLTGVSLNPARSLGPAVFGHWEMHWVYWVGPMVGAIAAVWAYKLIWEESLHDHVEPPPLKS